MPAIKLIHRLHREQLLNKLYKEFHSERSTLPVKFDFVLANDTVSMYTLACVSICLKTYCFYMKRDTYTWSTSSSKRLIDQDFAFVMS